MQSNSFAKDDVSVIITVEHEVQDEGSDLLYAGTSWEDAVLKQIRYGRGERFIFRLWEKGEISHEFECAGGKSITVGYIAPVILERSVLVDLPHKSDKFITIDNSLRPVVYTLSPTGDYRKLDIERIPHAHYHRTTDSGFVNPNALLDMASELDLKISPYAYKKVCEQAIEHTRSNHFLSLEEAHKLILK